MELTQEQRTKIGKAMTDYEIFNEHGIYSLSTHLAAINEVRAELGMPIQWGFPSCIDCMNNYVKELYNLWK